MKKFFILSAAMMAISLVGFTACSDSDDENKTEPIPTTEVNLNANQRIALASVLNMLTDQEFSDTTDIDFENRTFESDFGDLRDHSRLWERSIKVRNADLAESYFRSLAGGGSAIIRDTDDGCVMDLTNLDTHSSGRKQNFGKLTFHRGSDADNVGYADVEIPCIPGLERIVYKTQEQWGDNGGFESPIGYGEVFFGDGLYWICVREATGYNSYLSGVLVNIQPGRGEGWHTIYEKEKWTGGWSPDNHCHRETYGAIIDYVNLCGDPNFKRQKRRILNQPYGTKVFPRGYLWHRDSNQDWILNSSIAGPGFATLDGYCHYAEEPWAIHGIAIVVESWEANYRASRAKWWRRCRFCCTNVEHEEAEQPDAYMAQSTWKRPTSSGFRYFDYWYTSVDDFGNFLGSALVYTARTEMFIDRIPNGFTKVDI